MILFLENRSSHQDRPQTFWSNSEVTIERKEVVNSAFEPQLLHEWPSPRPRSLDLYGVGSAR